MNNRQHIHVDEALLAKYLAGEATADEAMAVDDWLQAGASNRETFRQVARIWGDTYRAPHADAGWERFAASRRPRYRYTWWAAAAAVLLCVVLAYQFFTTGSTTPVEISSAAAIVRDTLPDRSTVVLHPGSRLTFQEAFNPRMVQMEGEAFFDVVRDEFRPFSVKAGELDILVLGTTFNVATAPQLITVKVNTGRVRVSAAGDTAVVSEGESYTYHRAGRRGAIKATSPADRNGYAYATKKLVFEEAPLSQVIMDVSKAYNINIHLADEAAADCRISTAFNGEPLAYVLEVITASLGLQYEITGNHVNISGNGCR